jgi:hypothetical protein
MIFMDGGRFQFDLYGWRNWDTLDDLFVLFEEIQNHFAWQWSVHLGIGQKYLIPPEEFRTYVHRLSQENIQNGYNPYLHLELTVPYTGLNRHGEQRTIDEFAIPLLGPPDGFAFVSNASRRFDHWDHDDMIDISTASNTIMQRYAALARFLIPRLQPSYLWSAEYEDDLDIEDYTHWPKGTFKIMYWLNYFGPDVLTPEQKALFENPPFGIVEHFPDGGLWYQLSEDFEQAGHPYEEFIQIEKQVIKHFAPLGVEDMIWKFFAA